MSHADIIKELGGVSTVADWMRKESGRKLSRDAVYKWTYNGLPWRWRPLVAKMAKQRGVKLPRDIWPGGAS